MKILETVRKNWNWTGLVASLVIVQNPFGNLIVKDEQGCYWRICPEMLTCQKIATDEASFLAVWNRPDFQTDWNMTNLVLIAKDKLGTLEDGRCYCFKLYPALGGFFDRNNMSSILLEELIAFSGHMAEQLKNVPDGDQFKIELIP